MRDAFHEIAVAADDVGVVVDDLGFAGVVDGAEVFFSDGEADGFGEALAERAGGDFNAGGFAVLRVTGGVRAPLAELLELLERKIVAGEVQDAVLQGRRVAIGEHKAVAIGPERVGRVVLHELVEEQVGHGRAAERGAGVAVLGLFHLVDGEKTKGVDGELVDVRGGLIDDDGGSLCGAHAGPVSFALEDESGLPATFERSLDAAKRLIATRNQVYRERPRAS